MPMLTLLVVLERHGQRPPVGDLRPERLLRLARLLQPGGEVPRLWAPAGVQLPERALHLLLLLQDGAQRAPRGAPLSYK